MDDDERDQYQRNYPDEARTMQSYSARIRQEGERIGQQIGIQIEEANILLLQLEQEFGKIPDGVRRRVRQADPDTLLRWSGRVLSEDSIDAVLR